MEPQEHTSSPGPLRSTNSHLAQDHLATDQATTTANSTIDTTLAKASTSKQQQPFDEDPTSFAPRKAAAPTAALSSPTSPSSPPASSHPSSPTSPALSSPPLLTRIPGTPPTNPPPRFFTRPYRRPIDHSHHHGSAHGAGYLNSQGSASLGVRSAFKDFVVPAQIILFFSILNALWPTLLRIVTTTIEFLVLVLSSYSACARRSDNCYFLEPLLPDGQEGAYAITIQWTLRIVFCVLFFGGCAIISKRMEKEWKECLCITLLSGTPINSNIDKHTTTSFVFPPLLLKEQGVECGERTLKEEKGTNGPFWHWQENNKRQHNNNHDGNWHCPAAGRGEEKAKQI
ncbi:MAG: hypothetical protein J3R72DRAFT_59315 [Linnemannia gamsii]|nr:MAG: hypothetical protein J3R72DRAFT_59315 [Linnemannia gamsii]